MEDALAADPPRGYAPVPKGVRLLSIARGDDGAIVMNFSGELLIGGSGRALEDALHQIFMAASAARMPSPGQVDEYKVLVNGVTLESYLP